MATLIAGAILSTYTTPSTVAGDDQSSFYCEVSNPSGLVNSLAAILTVIPAPAAPVITSQPASVAVQVGSVASFSIAATGATSYQWYKNSILIAGATSTTYATGATILGDNGALYSCQVTGPGGTVLSASATLTVTPIVTTAPVITLQPVNQAVSVGATASFTVAASGVITGYQWLKNGAFISGATLATYTTPATALLDSGSLYAARVVGPGGTTTSNAATLTVTAVAPPPPPPPPAPTSGRIVEFPVAPGDIIQLPFDFISKLQAGETITSVTAVQVSVYSGADPSPSSILSGSATISRSIVYQGFTGGVVGNTYSLICTVATSLGRSVQLSSYVTMEPRRPGS